MWRGSGMGAVGKPIACGEGGCGSGRRASETNCICNHTLVRTQAVLTCGRGSILIIAGNEANE